MDTFRNVRLEGLFQESYKGYNQFIFTGGIDDLFFVSVSKSGSQQKLCRICEAFQAYGKKEGYDFVLTVKPSLEIEYGSEDQRRRFAETVRANSTRLVESGRSARQFVPRPRQPLSSAPAEGTGPTSLRQATEDVAERTGQQDQANILGQITRLLRRAEFRTLVIVPEAERLLKSGSLDAAATHRLEIIFRDWRDIVQSGNADTKTILIVNPHRLDEFRRAEHLLSCYDHNVREVVVGIPPVNEMRAWLNYYKLNNGIGGTAREAERVILTGRANVEGNLQNFVSWIQAFYSDGCGERTWNALLGAENVEASESKDDLLEELDGMIGLEEVKREVHAIVDMAERNVTAAANASYHMFFLGNPGSGKTVVANIVAKLFWAMELRTSRKVVSVSIQDISSPINEGESIQRMKDKVNEAMGGVLFIDEAYQFAENEWGRKAFETLLTEMENNRSNLTVILAGYEERLQKLKDINPGIDSRIPLRLHFADYTKEQKLEIFKLFLRKEAQLRNVAYEIAPGVEEKLLRVLDGCEGNGRGVRNLLERILQNLGDGNQIRVEHVVDPHAPHPEKADLVLANLDQEFVGMAGMKERLRQYFQMVEWNLERGQKLGLTRQRGTVYRIRFTGSPGTGKTSVARYMGRFFHAMGICETDQCVEVGATSLKGAYVGQAQQTVNNLFHENRGKVIFIDEIYSLYNPQAHQDDSFSREVIDTLVRCLTAEEYRGTVVVVAGYKDKVDQFMEANPGLASRFPDEIIFEDYDAKDCVEIFKLVAAHNQYELSSDAELLLQEYFAWLKMSAGANFGNARDVNIVFGKSVQRMIARLAGKAEKTEEDYRLIRREDIPSCPGASIEATDETYAVARCEENEHDESN